VKREPPHALPHALPMLTAMVVSTILFGTIYVVAQQLDRLSANDGPERLASQVAVEVQAGQSTTLDAQPHVDLAHSLAPFVVVEDASGKPIAGSGFLTGSLVSVPAGVLANAAKTGQDNVTWQPQPGLRFATVTLRAGDKLVTAGQSLQPSERRSQTFQLLIGAGWLAAMLVLVGSWLWRWLWLWLWRTR
jgi:hypothetical protein